MINVDIENSFVYQAWITYLATYVAKLMDSTPYQKLTVSLELLLNPESRFSFAPRKMKPVVLDLDQRMRMTEEIEKRFRELYPDKNIPRYAYLAEALFQFLAQADHPERIVLKNLPQELYELSDLDKTDKLPDLEEELETGL